MVDGTASSAFIKEMSGNILSHTEGKSLVVIVNKNDILTAEQAQAMRVQLEDILPGSAHLLFISAKQGENISALEQLIIKEAHLPENQSSDIIVTNARHYQALVKAQEAIERAIYGLTTGISGDFVSQDIRECMHHLGEITGEISTTDILSTIFSKFCIGK